MATLSTINLIRTKTNQSPQLSAITASLKKTGYVLLIVFLCIGVLIGVLYALFSAQEQTLVTQKNEYVKRVNSDQQSEGFFRSIKDRTSLVGKTLASIQPWTQLLDEVNGIVTPPVLSNISIDTQNKIIMTVNAATIDDLLTIVNAVIGQTQAGRFKNPQLVSFQILKTGNIVASFSFSAIF